MKLLTSQKNILFDIVQEYELPAAQFIFQESKGKISPDICTDLAYSNSEFFFGFDTYAASKIEPYYCVYSPGEHTFTAETYTGSWFATLREFHVWMASLKREITAVNKWDRLKIEMENLHFSFSNDDNNKFTVVEYMELTDKVSLLKEGVVKLGLLPEQMRVLNDKLDHLIILAKEMNKYDWKNLFIGTTMSIIIQLSVTPENAKNLFALIKSIFNSYLLP